MQNGSSETLIGWSWRSGKTNYVPLWDRMEGAWLMAMDSGPGVQSLKNKKSIIININSKTICLVSFTEYSFCQKNFN
jgi:hypothetical protein